MDFDLSEEQRLLKESLDRLIGDRYAFEQRKGYAQNPEGWSREMWGNSPNSGCSACRSRSMAARRRSGRDDDRDGSLRPRAGARTISCDGRARRRLSSPWRQRRAMRRSHSEDRRRQPHLRLRPYRAAIALRPARYRDASGARRAGWVLDGEKGVVVHGDTADKLIVTARRRPRRRDRDGVAAFIVDGEGTGVSRRGYPTQDGLRAAEISLARVGSARRSARRAGEGIAAGRTGRRRGDRGAVRRGGRRRWR